MEYAKALTEVDEILNHLSEEDYKKIPEDLINIIKQYKDKNYVWKYDETKKLKDQDTRKDTLSFLSYINMEYLVNDGQREFLERLHEINEEKQFSKQEIKEIFPNTTKNSGIDEIERNGETEELRALVVVKESFFRKVFNRFKRIFGKKQKKVSIEQQIEQKQEEMKKNIVIPPKKTNLYDNLKNGNKKIENINQE